MKRIYSIRPELVLDGFNWHFQASVKFPLTSTVDKTHGNTFFGNVENQTKGHWMRKKTATSVPCSPHGLNKFYLKRTQEKLIESFLCEGSLVIQSVNPSEIFYFPFLSFCLHFWKNDFLAQGLLLKMSKFFCRSLGWLCVQWCLGAAPVHQKTIHQVDQVPPKCFFSPQF